MSSASAARALENLAPVPAEVHEDRLCVRIPASACTLAGFRAWATSDEFPDHIRAAYIDQEVFLDMSNESRSHVRIKDEITRVVGAFCKEEDKGEYYGDGFLVSNEEADVSNNPDGSFYYWETLESGRVRLVPRADKAGDFKELEGTPDWVLEVISPGSVQKDTHRLRAAYHRAGISEYWLVDALGEAVVLQILYRRKNGYVAAPVKDGWQKSRVFDREFRLTQKRNRAKHWDHTLEMRPV